MSAFSPSAAVFSKGNFPAFHPAWFCPGPHLQSVWGYFFHRPPACPWRREHWETPDGDVLALDFLEPPGREGGSLPTLLALHGLEGSSDSFYIRGLAAGAAARGWRTAALNFRSCGGAPNRLPRLYHSGETGDLEYVVCRLSEGLEGPLLLAGFSLGGNVLLKWLGERGEGVPGHVLAAAAVSASFAPGACAAALDSPRGALYRRSFIHYLREKFREIGRRHPGVIDPEKVRRMRTFAELDRWFTAPLHGFADERDYYERASSLGDLPRIRVPTLLLSAADDPIVPSDVFPREAVAASPWLRGALLPTGGHIGFVEGRNPRAAGFWAEKRLLEFLAACLEGEGSLPPLEG
ncbi:MAG: alpha/beta fold hydrolase [bacterium]